MNTEDTMTIKEAHERMQSMGLADRLVCNDMAGGWLAKGVIDGVTIKSVRPAIEDACGACCAAAEAVRAYGLAEHAAAVQI